MSGFVTETPQVQDPSLSRLFDHSLKAGSMCASGTTSFSEVTVICQFDKTAYPLSHIDHLFNIAFGTTSLIEAKFKLSEILGFVWSYVHRGSSIKLYAASDSTPLRGCGMRSDHYSHVSEGL